MQICNKGVVIFVLAGMARAGPPSTDNPCDKAGTLVEGINDLTGLPVDHTDSDGTEYLEWICLGHYCDIISCFPSFEFRWAEYTATCTQALSITTHTSEGEVGPAPLVMSTCECRLSYWRPPLCVLGAGCPLNDYSISFLTVPGESYKFAIFGGESATIEPLEDMTYVCNHDYYWFGYYTGEFYDDVAAFVSCQSDCDSPTCNKCFDADEDGAVTLRDFAEFQNNAPW